ncbi:retroviral-like aspartic protease family protein [Leptospira dzoumogneensis]|uniref:Aspartyl protease n=1 Tax=Leptospira dzoumogneensis TaxID=2484904 RepID=A0A4Z1A936_9LEPT|nr:retropepsin-like aspartic protease [Leptospira dzoumogneensis]TGM96096.1 aspartyl protease [Leptospira dzoumogneensis]
MGRIYQKAELQNTMDILDHKNGRIPSENIRKLELEFLVDTGAAMICLPADLIQTLGLQPLYSRPAITANGTVQSKIFSPIQLKIWDRECNLEVMELPIGTPPLLGYLALETLDLYPNPQKQILEGNPKYNGQMMIYLLVA